MRDINDYVEKYQDEPFESHLVDIRRRMLIEQCKKFRHRNILEIGCGLKPFFADFHDYEYMVIVEPGAGFAARARELASEKGKNVKVIEGFCEERISEIKALGLELDFVILSSVLHELEDPRKMLGGIRELCGRSTVLHVNVPNANSLHRIIAKEMGLIEDVHERSEQMKLMQRNRTYDIQLLQEEISRAGFEVVSQGSYFIKPFTHGQMQKCLDFGIISGDVLIGLEKLSKYLPEYGAEIFVNCRRRSGGCEDV